jgi:hypothetical protein
MLGIGTRKIGTEIHCPTCGTKQIVPTEESANLLRERALERAPAANDTPPEIALPRERVSAFEAFEVEQALAALDAFQPNTKHTDSLPPLLLKPEGPRTSQPQPPRTSQPQPPRTSQPQPPQKSSTQINGSAPQPAPRAAKSSVTADRAVQPVASPVARVQADEFPRTLSKKPPVEHHKSQAKAGAISWEAPALADTAEDLLEVLPPEKIAPPQRTNVPPLKNSAKTAAPSSSRVLPDNSPAEQIRSSAHSPSAPQDDLSGLNLLTLPADLSRQAPHSAPTTSPPQRTPPSLDHRSSSPAAPPDLPKGIWITHRTLALQVGLLLGLSLVTFGFGWFIGRGVSQTRQEEQQAAAARLTVFASFLDARQTPQPDTGAVVLVWPKDSQPAEPLAIQDLLPESAEPGFESAVVRTLELMGGAQGRTNSEGKLLSLHVPRGGPCYVLVLSKNAVRTANQVPKTSEIEILAKLFGAEAIDLLGQRAYRLKLEEVRGSTILMHTFNSKG